MFTIFKTFFLLGWISFGGPAAHIGYFRQTFVVKLQWLSDSDYAQLVALSQFLPGPGSSQVGFALGYQRGGLMGACLAFLGFTLPSMLIMLLLAMVSSELTNTPLFQQVVHGLKLLAVVVVANATWGMYQNFCQSKLTAGLCVLSAVALLTLPSMLSQILILLLASAIGSRYLTGPALSKAKPFKASLTPLVLFALLFIGLPMVSQAMPLLGMFNDFFQAGSLVFGGGHVVLPLLQNLVGDKLSQDVFLTGYAAAQAIPGPMFTFATYLGYNLSSQPILGALVATLAVFLPGFLLLLGVLKNWQALASKPRVAGALNGLNAAVVGLLLSALYQPVFTSAVLTPLDMALVIAGGYLHHRCKLAIGWLIVLFAFAGVLIGLG